MANHNISSRRGALAAAVLVLLCLLLAAMSAPSLAVGYFQANLVSDVPGLALKTDPLLVNPWGLAVNPSNSIWWVANEGTGTSTLYDNYGNILPLVVNIPPGANSQPTGIVYNNTNDFLVSDGINTSKAIFIFDTLLGTIAGWDPSVNLTNAIQVVDRSAFGAVYTGLALGKRGTANFLFAANFGQGTVDVFDAGFNYVESFTDPDVPVGYAPFNVEIIKGKLYVAFAKQGAGGDEEPGEGFGYVIVFNTDGDVIKRLIRRGPLNAPWGMALAPDNFGEFSNTLLVGNFGNGRINAFDPKTGRWLGLLHYAIGGIIQIEGLWALEFRPQPTYGAKFAVLYFTAGIDDETHGLFGYLYPSQLKSGFPFGNIRNGGG